MSDSFIKEFWNNQGERHGASHWASWGDENMISLEVETINKHIETGSLVLDVGCANGHATAKQFNNNKASKIVGVDYAETMIDAAKQAYSKEIERGEIEFRQADILRLPFEDNQFDIVYTTRVLINLPNYSQQLDGIKECMRVVKPGGKVILLEAFWEPLMLLNSMRQLVGLQSLVEHDFNRYLKLSNLESSLDELDLSYQIEDFSSVYYLGSRFLRELVTDVTEYEGYSNPVNNDFYSLQKKYSGGGMGVQQAVIISL